MEDEPKPHPSPPLQRFSSFLPGAAHQQLSETAKSRTGLKIAFQEALKRPPGAATKSLTPQQWRWGEFSFLRDCEQIINWRDCFLQKFRLNALATIVKIMSNHWVEVHCARSFHAFSPCFTKSGPSRCSYPHFTDVEIGSVTWLPQTLQRSKTTPWTPTGPTPEPAFFLLVWARGSRAWSLGPDCPGSNSAFAWAWASYLTALCLSFLLCKMKIRTHLRWLL